MNQKILNSLNEIEYTLKYLLAMELSKSGLSQAEIGKRLKIATKKVNHMLKGIKS